MSLLYEDPQQTATAEAALHTLQQGRRAAKDYVSEFRRWSSDTNWNDAALLYKFRMGLSEPPKDEQARVGIPKTLDALINLSIQIDGCLRERRSERTSGPSRPVWVLPRVPSFPHSASSAPEITTSDASEPMQLGLLRPSLTPEERQCQWVNNLCLYCGEPGHCVRTCPAKLRKCFSISPVLTPALLNNIPQLAASISLQLPGGNTPVPAKVDSGACNCFMDLSVATLYQVSLRPKVKGLSVHLAVGSAIKSGPVTQETVPLNTTIASNHEELLFLDLIESPLFPIILGLLWLRAHNPQIDWIPGRVSFVSPYCHQNCLQETVDVPSPLLCLESDGETHQAVPQFLGCFQQERCRDSSPT